MADQTHKGRIVDKPWGYELIWAQVSKAAHGHIRKFGRAIGRATSPFTGGDGAGHEVAAGTAGSVYPPARRAWFSLGRRSLAGVAGSFQHSIRFSQRLSYNPA